MSSDVYLGFCPDGDPMVHSLLSRRCNTCDVERIGHLGTMHYFGFDLLAALKAIPDRRISKAWAEQATRAIGAFQAAAQRDAALSPEAFERAYGYRGPDGIEWDDALTADDVAGLLRAHEGWFWRIWVD